MNLNKFVEQISGGKGRLHSVVGFCQLQAGQAALKTVVVQRNKIDCLFKGKHEAIYTKRRSS